MRAMQGELAGKEKGIPGRRKRMFQGKKVHTGSTGRGPPSEHALRDESMLLVLLNTASAS